MRWLSIVLVIGVTVLGMNSTTFAGSSDITVAPSYIDGNSSEDATPFAVYVQFYSGATSATAYVKPIRSSSANTVAYIWNGSEWVSSSTWAVNLQVILTGGDWSGWVYLKSKGYNDVTVRFRTGTNTLHDYSSESYTLLNMSSDGSWVYDSGNPPAGKVIVALDGSNDILGTWVAENNGINDQFPANASYPGSPATGFWEMSVPASTSIAKLQARNADNSVYAEDVIPGWNSGSAGSSQELTGVTLPVTLSSFTALPGDGRIVLRWITESEIDNLGFNVYRCLKEDGEYIRINGDLIRGAGSSAMRSEYSFTDVRLTNGRAYCYKLEDVSFDGKHTLHGPIQAIPKAAAKSEEEPSEEEGRTRSYWGKVKHSMQAGEEKD